MTPHDWQQIKELFAEAIEREGTDRAAFIEHMCEWDEAAGLEVKRLVAEHERTAGFLVQRQQVYHCGRMRRGHRVLQKDLVPTAAFGRFVTLGMIDQDLAHHMGRD